MEAARLGVERHDEGHRLFARLNLAIWAEKVNAHCLLRVLLLLAFAAASGVSSVVVVTDKVHPPLGCTLDHLILKGIHCHL